MLGSPLLMGGGAYAINKSVRFRSSASAYLTRSYSNAPDNWTLSVWIKRDQVGVTQTIAGSRNAGGNFSRIYIDSLDRVCLDINGSTMFTASPQLRDTSAWYHIVVSCVFNSTGYLYINGVQRATWPSGTASYLFQSGYTNYIGYGGSADYFTGYMADLRFVYGASTFASNFGQVNSVTKVWEPKEFSPSGAVYAGSFWLTFEDTSSFGKDTSGFGFDWTSFNISNVLGTTYDSMFDVPSQYADGANGRGNYCTFDGSAPINSSSSIVNGNLRATLGGAAGGNANGMLSSFRLNSGKWYAEFTINAVAATNQYPFIGITAAPALVTGNVSSNSASYCIRANGNIDALGVFATAYGSSFSAGDICMVAVDYGAGKIWYGKNGTWFNLGEPRTGANPSSSGISSASYWAFAVSGDGNAQVDANFGQRPFSYTIPNGFRAVNTNWLADSAIKNGADYFNATIYTGSNSVQSVVNSGSMQPDMVWMKNRSAAGNHYIVDSVRAGSLSLNSNTTSGNANLSGPWQSFLSNGFQLGADTSTVNINGNSYVGWQWKRGTTPGFDIVLYTGDGTSFQFLTTTLSTPQMMLVKRTDATGGNWNVYHESVGATGALILNSTVPTQVSSTYWDNTPPYSVDFCVGSANNAASAPYVAFLFQSIPGFSAFGSYTGTGLASASGPFIHCGFLPRFVMIKRTDSGSSDNWIIVDSARSLYNLYDEVLLPNATNAEALSNGIDILSNGFKIRTTNTATNASASATYVYAAFAENPFKYVLAR